MWLALGWEGQRNFVGHRHAAAAGEEGRGEARIFRVLNDFCREAVEICAGDRFVVHPPRLQVSVISALGLSEAVEKEKQVRLCGGVWVDLRRIEEEESGCEALLRELKRALLPVARAVATIRRRTRPSLGSRKRASARH